MGRGMFDTEVARLAEAAKFHLGSEWIDPEQFHSALEKDARFIFDADKEVPLVLAKSHNIKTKASAAKTNIKVPKNNIDKKPVAIEIGETINKESPSLPVDKNAKNAAFGIDFKKTGKRYGHTQ